MDWIRQKALYKQKRAWKNEEEEDYQENLPEFLNESEEEQDTEVKQEAEESPRMRALRMPRNRAYMNAIMKGDDMNAQDKEIVEKVHKKMEEQKDEKQKSEKKQSDKLLGIVTKCYIHGCCVHVIDKRGFIMKHYGESIKFAGSDIDNVKDMPERIKKGYDLYRNKNCQCVEVYEKHICVISSSGGSAVIEG